MLVDAICALPAAAAPGDPGIQCDNLLLWHCAAQRASHLMRLLPRGVLQGAVTRIDDVVFEAFVEINGLQPGEGAKVQERDAMPISYWGIGLRRLIPTCDAAHVARWMQRAQWRTPLEECHQLFETGNRLQYQRSTTFIEPSSACTPNMGLMLWRSAR